MRFRKQEKCSALVITLLILGVILTIGMSISAISLKERKASIGSNQAVISYEAADNGVEEVLNEIFQEHPGGTVSQIIDCDNSSGLIKENVANPTYEVELMDLNGDKINCSSGSTTLISAIKSIKSVGISSGKSKRAVEVPIE